ncbi:PilT protein-like protein [Aurantimonas sp. 22II-16-19i]|nr:PilT protein-like protein [Aurantimonas sp. 22II-16-19i]
MKGYLIDTNVISTLAPRKKTFSPSFAHWLRQTDRDGLVFMSVVTLHELERGIERLDLRGATAKAGELRKWLETVLVEFGGAFLPVDLPTAALSGKLEARAIARGGNPGIGDALIAGTAHVNGLTVITENARDFAMFGVCHLLPSQAASI